MYFNLKEGVFENKKTNNSSIEGNSLILFRKILGIKFDSKQLPVLSRDEKRNILNTILTYYKFHVDGFKDPKSLKVINQIFAD